MAESHRLPRLNDRIRDEIADLLMHDVQDPVLQGALISVTEVETAPDLSRARVFVSALGTEQEANAAVARMQAAAAFFRRELAARLNMRRTPMLEFHID